MTVVDASAIVELLLRTPRGEPVAGRLLSRGETLHAPHLLDVEVAQVLRRYERRGDIDRGTVLQALGDLLVLRLRRYPHGPLLPRVFELRNNLTAYDAVYVALAETLDAPLVTCDGGLASAPGHRARVEYLEARP